MNGRTFEFRPLCGYNFRHVDSAVLDCASCGGGIVLPKTAQNRRRVVHCTRSARHALHLLAESGKRLHRRTGRVLDSARLVVSPKVPKARRSGEARGVLDREGLGDGSARSRPAPALDTFHVEMDSAKPRLLYLALRPRLRMTRSGTTPMPSSGVRRFYLAASWWPWNLFSPSPLEIKSWRRWRCCHFQSLSLRIGERRIGGGVSENCLGENSWKSFQALT